MESVGQNRPPQNLQYNINDRIDSLGDGECWSKSSTPKFGSCPIDEVKEIFKDAVTLFSQIDTTTFPRPPHTENDVQP